MVSSRGIQAYGFEISGGTKADMIRRATQDDARAIHDIMCSIAWIKNTVKSEDGYVKTKESSGRGEIFVSTDNSAIIAMMILRQDMVAASLGYNIWSMPLVATIECERRKGHARRLVKAAKRTVGDAVIQAHVQNDASLALLVSEGFIAVEGQADVSGYPLYEWRAS
jgi:hypothetical protein